MRFAGELVVGDQGEGRGGWGRGLKRRGRRIVAGGDGFVELPASHDVGELFAARGAACVACGGGAGIPNVSSDIIERHTFAEFVEIAEAGFGGGEALVCGETNEPRGFHVVALNGDAVKIKIGKIVLRVGKAGVCGDTKPVDGFRVVAWSSGAAIVEGGEVELSDGVGMPGGGEVPLEGFTVVFGDTVAVLIERSEIIFCSRILLSGSSLIILEGQGVIAANELAMFVEIAEIKLSVGIILRGRSAQQLKGGLDVCGGRVVGQGGFCKAVLESSVLRGGLRIGDGGVRNLRRL